MGSANERRRYTVTSSLIAWRHTHDDPCSDNDNKAMFYIYVLYRIVNINQTVIYLLDIRPPHSTRIYIECCNKYMFIIYKILSCNKINGAIKLHHWNYSGLTLYMTWWWRPTCRDAFHYWHLWRESLVTGRMPSHIKRIMQSFGISVVASLKRLWNKQSKCR